MVERERLPIPEVQDNPMDGYAVLQKVARQASPLTSEQHTQLFTELDTGGPPQAEQALQSIAESYLGYTSVLAYRKWWGNRDIEYDDIFGAACEALVVASYNFAKTHDYRNFPPFLTTTIRNFMAAEVVFYRYRVTSNTLRTELSAYLRARSKLEQADSQASLHDIAAEADLPWSTVMTVEAIRRQPVPIDPGTERLSDFRSDSPKEEVQESATEQSILLERSLAMLNPYQADIIDKCYGLTGLQYSVQELRQQYNLGSDQNARAAIYKAKKELTLVATAFRDGTFDFRAWRQSHQSCRNVLMFLSFTGEPAPAESTLSELRIVAMKHLLAMPETKMTKDVIAELYGLKDGIPKDGATISRITNIQPHNIRRYEVRFLEKFGIVFKKGGKRNT